MIADEPYRLPAQAERQRLAVGTRLQLRVVPRGEVPAHGRADLPAALVDLKAEVLRIGTVVAEVPLAGEEGAVAGFAEHLGKGDLVRSQAPFVFGRQQLAVPPELTPRGTGRGADPVGHPVARRVLAGQDAGARGAAHLAVCIALDEAHPTAGQAVDMRALVEAAPLDAEVAPPQVVGQNEHHVGPVGGAVPSRHGPRSLARAASPVIGTSLRQLIQPFVSSPGAGDTGSVPLSPRRCRIMLPTRRSHV